MFVCIYMWAGGMIRHDSTRNIGWLIISVFSGSENPGTPGNSLRHENLGTFGPFRPLEPSIETWCFDVFMFPVFFGICWKTIWFWSSTYHQTNIEQSAYCHPGGGNVFPWKSMSFPSMFLYISVGSLTIWICNMKLKWYVMVYAKSSWHIFEFHVATDSWQRFESEFKDS